jgi:hypothetical protein
VTSARVARAEAEISAPHARGTTFTLVQAWARARAERRRARAAQSLRSKFVATFTAVPVERSRTSTCTS